jgi:glycosyltransferase involved in cell wall biosynthesis
MRLAAFAGAGVFAGAERVLADLLAHLDPAIEATVLAPHQAVGEALIRRRPGARTLAAGGIADKSDVAGMRRWIGALRAVRPDVVQINLHMPWAARWETLLALAVPGVRVVVLENSPLPFGSARLRALKRLLSAGLAAHVAVGAQVGRDIERDAGLRPGTIRAIPIGVEPFDPPPRVPGAGTRIGTVARLDPLKRIDDLLRALAALPGVRLEIVGDGPDRLRLTGLAAQLGVADRVDFAGWAADTRAWLGRWDAFVLPSQVEGLPLVILDALLAEVPVVATAVGSVPETVRDGRTGVLVPVGDPGALAAGIRRVLEDAALARRLALAGRELVLARHAATRMARDFEALYAELLYAG